MAFKPDSRQVATVIASPNHGARVGAGRPDMIVLHYTGMTEAQAALDLLCAPHSKLSAHYLIHQDGHIVQLVPEARRAWHAGVAAWEGETDINSRSVGIEIVNPGHSYGYPDFPEAQIEAVTALCRDILARHRIRPDRVVAHSDVAPSRKNDPGEKFPWARLHAAGVGHWVEPVAPGADARGLVLGDHGRATAALKRALAVCGYAVTPTDAFDEVTRDVVLAFQRHFRPARVDGIADQSTIATLRRLIEACRVKRRDE
jgi:N-acetylmuramoyl-L-alanine amidase